MSVFERDAALWVGGGLNILLFLMQMVSQVGDKFEFLKNVNPGSRCSTTTAWPQATRRP